MENMVLEPRLEGLGYEGIEGKFCDMKTCSGKETSRRMLDAKTGMPQGQIRADLNASEEVFTLTAKQEAL